MAKQQVKTNAMRSLEKANIPFEHFEYDPGETDGQKVASLLGEDENTVFKTLVTEAPGRRYYVFVIPVCHTLDLKKAARAAGEKSLSMLKQKDLLPLTGYIHGGCSPVGMKKLFPTFIHESAKNLGAFCVSAGKVGCQIRVSPADIASLVGAVFADIIS